MKKKTVKFVSAVVALGVVSGAYVGVNSYVSSQEKKESEEEDTSVELTSLSTDDITSVAFTAGQDNVEFDKKDDAWSEKSDADFPVDQDTVNMIWILHRMISNLRQMTEIQYFRSVWRMNPPASIM